VKERIVALVDLDYFYAQCEELRNPSLKGKPVAVCIYSGRGGDSGAVSTSNYEARRLGIKSGMPIFQAKRNANEMTVFLPADLDYYEAISSRVMDYLRTLADVTEQASVDEAYLELTSRASGFEQAEGMMRTLKEELRRREGLTATVGIGPNKLLAKMASEVNKPDGLTCIPPDRADDFLSRMQVGKLFGVGHVTERKLLESGIATVTELRTKSLKELHSLLGRGMGEYLYRAARGIDDDPVQPRRREQYGRIITLREDTRDREVLIDNARKLLGEVVQAVRVDGVSFKTVSFMGVMDDLSIRTKSASVSEYLDSEDTAVQLLPRLVDEFLKTNDGNLRRVGVKVSGLKERKAEGSGQRALSDFI